MTSPHVVPVRVYAAVFGSLLFLTALTTAVAFVNLGGDVNSIVALGIAVLKALLVILFFMHVLYSNRFTWVMAGAGIFWLLILVVFTLTDFLTRASVAGPGS